MRRLLHTSWINIQIFLPKSREFLPDMDLLYCPYPSIFRGELVFGFQYSWPWVQLPNRIAPKNAASKSDGMATERECRPGAARGRYAPAFGGAPSAARSFRRRVFPAAAV